MPVCEKYMLLDECLQFAKIFSSSLSKKRKPSHCHTHRPFINSLNIYQGVYKISRIFSIDCHYLQITTTKLLIIIDRFGKMPCDISFDFIYSEFGSHCGQLCHLSLCCW